MNASETVWTDETGLEHTRLTYAGCIADAVSLANQIEDHSRETGQQYDGMVVPPRGAYLVADVLSHSFEFDAAQMIGIGLTSYKYGLNTGQPKRGQMPTRELMEGKDWLIADEVADTMKTLEEIIEICMALGARSLDIAVLDWKPDNNQTNLVPKFCVNKRGRGWIHYPSEMYENAGLFSVVKKRTPEELEQQTIARQKYLEANRAKDVSAVI